LVCFGFFFLFSHGAGAYMFLVTTVTCLLELPSFFETCGVGAVEKLAGLLKKMPKFVRTPIYIRLAESQNQKQNQTKKKKSGKRSCTLMKACLQASAGVRRFRLLRVLHALEQEGVGVRHRAEKLGNGFASPMLERLCRNL
jgi:hypothetical protein